jgi:hypothetical protein
LAKLYSENNYFAAELVIERQTVLGKEQLSISPLLKFKTNWLTIGATYNLGLSDIQQYGGNSFMVSVGFDVPNFINSRGFRYR